MPGANKRVTARLVQPIDETQYWKHVQSLIRKRLPKWRGLPLTDQMIRNTAVHSFVDAWAGIPRDSEAAHAALRLRERVDRAVSELGRAQRELSSLVVRTSSQRDLTSTWRDELTMTIRNTDTHFKSALDFCLLNMWPRGEPEQPNGRPISVQTYRIHGLVAELQQYWTQERAIRRIAEVTCDEWLQLEQLHKLSGVQFKSLWGQATSRATPTVDRVERLAERYKKVVSRQNARITVTTTEF